MLSKRCRAGVIAAIVAAPGAAVAGPLTQFVGFGASLLDAGNVQLLAESFGAPDPTPASQGYFMGRFSDGFNVADFLSLAISGAPTVPSALGGRNYAFGGARAVTNADPIPDLGAQLAAWQADVGGVADPNALYAIVAGNNDVLAIQDPTSTDAPTPQEVADALAGAVQVLNDAGARRIVLTNVGGASPAAVDVNNRLGPSLDALALDPATMLTEFDFSGFLQAVQFAPASLGLPALIIDPPCLQDPAITPAPDVDCSDYAVFDTIHPTEQVYAAWAQQIEASIPLPSAGLLMLTLVGLGLAVSKGRRAFC